MIAFPLSNEVHGFQLMSVEPLEDIIEQRITHATHG